MFNIPLYGEDELHHKVEEQEYKGQIKEELEVTKMRYMEVLIIWSQAYPSRI